MGLFSQREARKFERSKLLCSTLNQGLKRFLCKVVLLFYTHAFMCKHSFTLVCTFILAFDTILTSKRVRDLGASTQACFSFKTSPMV